MSVPEKLFDGGLNGVDVFVLGSRMYALVRGGSCSLISCVAPSEELFAAAASLGRVKHVFLLDTSSERELSWAASWVKRFEALLWAPQAVTGTDMLLGRDTLLPFPGKVFLFQSALHPIAALFVSQHKLLLAGSVVPGASSDTDTEAWIGAAVDREAEGASLARDYETLLTTLRPEVFLGRRGAVVSRAQVIQHIVGLNNRGLLARKAPAPASRLRILWFFLFLLNVFVFLVYLVSRGSSS